MLGNFLTNTTLGGAVYVWQLLLIPVLIGLIVFYFQWKKKQQ